MMRKLWLILIFSIILTGIASAQDKTSAASSVQAAAAAVAEPPFDFAAADKELNKSNGCCLREKFPAKKPPLI